MVTGKPFLTVNQIQDKVRELAGRISRDFEGGDMVAICILRGAFMFFSDLIRNIRVPLVIDFVTASSYVQTSTTGEVTLHCDLRESLRGKDVLLVEDIVDTGVTLSHIRERILAESPRSLRICGLLNKQARRVKDVPVDYMGFDIPNIFVVGYGLDYENKYRNLPYIAEFKMSREDI